MTTNINSESIDKIKNLINDRFDSLYTKDKYGNSIPFVCICCDRLVSAKDVEIITREDLKSRMDLLKVSEFNKLADNESLRNCYIFESHASDVDEGEDVSWMKELLLSPRSVYLRDFEKKGSGYVICQTCKTMLKLNTKPKYSIANNYCVGSPPACLTNLSDVELAYLTPVKTFGYCFAFTGGFQKQLKGSLSYFKVDPESIARQVCAFDVLGLSKNIVILIYGDMTPEQRTIAQKKNEIRTDYVMKAVEWLSVYNIEWKNKNLIMDDVRASLQNPVLVDHSRSVDGDPLQNNIEQTESFQIFFPDAFMNSTTGGQESIEDLKKLVYAATSQGYKLEVKSELLKKSVQDYKDNNLVNACLLQFPYGRGGMHEERLKGNGDMTTSIDLQDYVTHLSYISQPQFHHSLFSLILYNISFKQYMIKTAGWRVRNALDANAISNELTPDDVQKAIHDKQRGRNVSNTPGKQYVDAVDAVAGSVPHSNETTKKARKVSDTMNHHFGSSAWFFTVTPDDGNSFLVQIYSANIIDDDQPVSMLSDEELMQRAKKRTELRIKVPGMCAFFFEEVLKIIIEEVLGWDMKAACRTKTGLFGETEAFLIAIEEQGRGTLHAHIQVWIRKFSEIREQLNSKNRGNKRKAEKELCQVTDLLTSCTLCVFKCKKFEISSKFPHEECKEKRALRRKVPKIVEDQDLRNLRHIHGQKNNGGKFAYCPQCSKNWTNEEFIESFLLNEVKVPNLAHYPDTSVKRLKAMAVEYQKSENSHLDERIIAAAYNHHIHTRISCYRKHVTSKKPEEVDQSKKREREEDCRYRLPQRPNKCTKIVEIATLKWYEWTGDHHECSIKEIVPSRDSYDAFQNTCCPSISYSKLTCNTNISPVMPGPLSQYVCKYVIKDTNKDDTAEHNNLVSAIQKCLSRERNCDSDTSEGMRRILRGSFAHQSTNVIGPTLASFLTRQKTRFIFSHESTWCPIRDIKALLNDNAANVSIRHQGKVPFYECNAMHYLCRPKELEKYSAYDFYANYEICRTSKTEEENSLKFWNGKYTHPSYRQKGEKYLQVVRRRDRPVLPKVHQWDFPDSANFGQNILLASKPYAESMETYAELVLLLFYPYREKSDLLKNNSFVDKLKSAFTEDKIPKSAQTFLQNLLDAKSNSLRDRSAYRDDLQRVTKQYLPTSAECDATEIEKKDDDELITGNELDEFLKAWDEDFNLSNYENSNSSNVENNVPESCDVKIMKDKGAHKCGYECLAALPRDLNRNQEIFCTTQSSNVQPIINQPVQLQQSPTIQAPDKKELIKILFKRTSRRKKSLSDILNREVNCKILDANGSAKSIVNWARKLGLDKGQQRAFEIITSTFVLTFYTATDTQMNNHDTYSIEKSKLYLLADRSNRKTDQLLCFLHGPGGCGKTTVIDLVIAYAREFCGYMENYVFTKRTIVVTAMTGVAATILLGETTHSALYLNQKKPINGEQIELWSETRLLIIDEISFASKDDFQEINKKLGLLKQQAFRYYGGLNIIFSGDLRQLEPVGNRKNPIYQDDCPEFRDWINCYIELNGMHRFKDDKKWGELLFRFREGNVTEEDINLINSRVASKVDKLPNNMRYATFFNKDRDAINAGLFEQRCEQHYKQFGNLDDSVIVFSDNLQRLNGSKVYERHKDKNGFWNNCGENDIKFPSGRGRMDPVLRLYQGLRVMLPTNTNVSLGQANGTQAYVRRLVLKPGEQFQQTKLNGKLPIKAVFASQIDFLELEHVSDRIQPSRFTVKPSEFSFKAQIPMPAAFRTKNEKQKIKMKATQLPVIVNNATTGHKLQGSGVDMLFVHNWSYVTNWVYVMLSRVRTLNGLYTRKKLTNNLKKFEVPQKLKTMIERFQTRKAAKILTDEQYQHITQDSDL